MKRIKLPSILLIIISTITILLVTYNLTYLYIHPKHLTYWSIFWACISALAVPISIIGFFLTHQKQQQALLEKDKIKQEKGNDIAIKVITDLYPDFITAYENWNSSYTLKNKLKFYAISYKILSEIDVLSEYSTIKAEMIAECKSNVIDRIKPIQIDFLEFYSNNNFLQEIFSDSDKKIKGLNKLITSNFDNPDTVLIVKTRGDNIKSVSGNWKISASRASILNYVIGIEMKGDGSKEFLGIYKIKKTIQVQGDRYRFKLKKIEFQTDTSERFKTALLKRLNIWTSANPVRYLDLLIEK